MKIPRREFLRRTGTTLAAAAAASPFAFAVDTAPRKVRIGVVGGGFGTDFQWHEHPDCVVQAVSDLRPDRRERLIKVYRCSTAYPSLEELVKAPDIDAVAIFTDGPLHVQHVLEAMKHGKHAISAVPAAWATMEQAELLLDTVKTYGLTYMMAETGSYQQSTISARTFFREGKFGDLYYCDGEYQHPGLEVLFFHNGQRTWRHGMAPMQWIGDRMSFYTAHPNGIGPVVIRSGEQIEKDDAGFERTAAVFEKQTRRTERQDATGRPKRPEGFIDRVCERR